MGDYVQHPAEGVLLKNPLDGQLDATRHTNVCTVETLEQGTVIITT